MSDTKSVIPLPTGVAADRETSIGSRIRLARKDNGLNQAELATRLGVSQPTVANWESGVHDPRQLMLAKIAEALQVQLGWLASGERSSVERDKHPTAAYIRRGLYHVPVLRLEDAILLLDQDRHDLHELATDYIPVTSGSDSLFGFFVNDEAMNLAFPGNTLAVVDFSHKVPADGDIVLLRRPDGSPLLRRWRRTPPRSTTQGRCRLYDLADLGGGLRIPSASPSPPIRWRRSRSASTS